MRTTVLGILVCVAAGCGTGEKCAPRSSGGQFCVPDAGQAPAGASLKLEIIDPCIAGCSRATLSCAVSRDAGTIALSIAGEVCEPPPGTSCTLACALTRLPCDVGVLPAGDYTVVSPDQSSRALHVGDAGTATCTALSL